jgi:predicted regulator of Ras-like GTPase activity (Roadblock/LC7/MglB family)
VTREAAEKQPESAPGHSPEVGPLSREITRAQLAPKADIQTVLEEMRREVDHLVAIHVVDVESGMALAGLTSDPNFDSGAAAASYANVVKANSAALYFLRLDTYATEDIVVTTRTIYILIRMLGPRHYFSIAMSRQGSLGLARSIMSSYAPRLVFAIPT